MVFSGLSMAALFVVVLMLIKIRINAELVLISLNIQIYRYIEIYRDVYIYTYMYILVGGLEHFLCFHLLGRIFPTDYIIFFRGVGIPPTSHN